MRTKPNPDLILENRRKIETALFNRYSKVSLGELCDYFELPQSSIKKDLEAIGRLPSEEVGAFNIEDLKRRRYKKIKDQLLNGKPEHEVLENFGLWRMPKELSEITLDENMKMFSEEDQHKFKRAIMLSDRGVPVSVSKKHLGLTKVDMAVLGDRIGKKEDTESKEVSVAYVKEGHSAEVVNTLTGFSKTYLERTEKGYDMEKYEKYYNKNGKNTEKAAEKDAKKEEAYQRWMSGKCTQQELADEYGVTRVTVMNWIREKKTDNLSERMQDDQRLLVRRRNVSSEARERRESQKDRVLSAFRMHPDYSLNRIATETKTDANTVKKYLIEEDLIKTMYEGKTSSALANIKKGAKDAESAYDKSVYANFKYGPNAGTVNKMNVTEHTELVERQHHMESMRRKKPLLGTAIKNHQTEEFLTENLLEREM